MGMYDTITVHSKWTGVLEEVGYQTKSLGCTLSNYEITEEGYLYLATHEDIIEPYDTLTPCRWPKEVNFYTDLKDGTWVEFVARLENGRVVNIETQPFNNYV